LLTWIHLRLRSLTLATLPALLVLATAALGADPPSHEAAQRLVARASGSTPMVSDLEELCDSIGGRVTGSPACDRAVVWAAARLRAAGLDVSLESFSVPALWLGGSVEGEATAPEHFSLDLSAAPGSPSTAGTLDARLVDAGDGSPAAFEKLGGTARGSIALVHTHVVKTSDDLFAEYSMIGPMLAAAGKAQAAAILFESSRPCGQLYRHPLTIDGTLTTIPEAVIARDQAERLARLAAHEEVQVRLALNNRTGGAYESKNVVAEIRGREKPDEIVLLGAHLDSWELGTGAEDNGVNAALVIDAARGLKELGLVPGRTVRFVLFTGEEQGMWGSAGYVKRHAAEMDKHVAAVIFDTGSGRTTGFYLNGRQELDQPVLHALAPVSSFGQFQNVPDAIDGTDNFDFALSGVPNLLANQDWAPYLTDYHSATDVFDRVNQPQAKTNEAIATALVWGLAESPERPARRQSHAEVEQLLKATKLDQQMKAFGQWDDWAAGRRGASQP
jgi:carboxypeptidase Q